MNILACDTCITIQILVLIKESKMYWIATSVPPTLTSFHDGEKLSLLQEKPDFEMRTTIAMHSMLRTTFKKVQEIKQKMLTA